jgi:Mor family transcriptional regulator
MSNLALNLTINDLPNDDLKIVADVVGLSTAVKLLQDLPGTLISIPKTGLNKCRNIYICNNYDGSKESRVNLAKKFGVSERYIIQMASKYRNRADLN